MPQRRRRLTATRAVAWLGAIVALGLAACATTGGEGAVTPAVPSAAADGALAEPEGAASNSVADASAALAVPAWRGVEPGTAWLGPDVLWRPREWLIFHLQDEQGGGFGLDLTVRDMNTYMQGARPVHVSVTGPDDRELATAWLADDGIIGGDPPHRDGIYDIFADMRYREWHRAHSPGGPPPGKTRSPYLEHPEMLPARPLHLDVPDAGPGLYRVTVIASWDHWISLTPSRPIPTGVHPGPGPLSVHGERLAQGAYLWVPATTRDLGISLTEEVAPFGATLTLQDESDRIVARRTSHSFQTYVIDAAPVTDSVYRVSVTDVQPGACLHVRGVPPVLAPDAEAARRIHGGMEIDAQGRYSFHHHQRVLDRWADAVRAGAASAPGVQRGAQGSRTDGLPGTGSGLDSNVAAVLAGVDALRRLSPFFWYDTRDVSYEHSYREGSPFTAPLRSGWYGLGLDSRAALSLRPAMEAGAAAGTIPDSVVAAWHTALRLWAGGRALMHVGETSNQWTYNLVQLLQIADITGDADIAHRIRRDVVRLTTTGSLGRLDPDGDPAVPDLGRVPAGYMSEQMGWDGQYGQEQEHNLAKVWEALPEPGIVDWWNDQYWLKTHVTLPKAGVPPVDVFSEVTSPTDFNFRTRYASHKTGLPAAARDQVVFGDLWRPVEGATPVRPWPALEADSFVRTVAGGFHFVRTGSYYAVVYSGHRAYDWIQFARAVVDEDEGAAAEGEGAAGNGAIGKGGHVRLVGYSGPGYGGFGRLTTKVGALSALSVDGTGPTWLAQNHNVWDANTVWGRRRTPVSPVWDEALVDPTIVCSGYAQPESSFDAATRTYRLREALRYAPLTVERTLRFEDERIVLDVALEATDNLDLAELWLALPYVADERTVRLFDEDLADAGVYDVPEPLLTDMRQGDAVQEASRFTNPTVRARVVDVSGPSGAGSAIVLPEELELLSVTPVRYRDVAMAAGSLNVPLPTQMTAGQVHRLRLVVLAHGEALTSADLEAARRP